MRSRLLQRAFGVVAGLTVVCGFAAAGRADPAPVAESLPTISITTASIAPADAVAGAAASVATIDASAAQPKPTAAHKSRHLRIQPIDTASLSGPVTTGLVGNTLMGHARVIEARATALRPAPLPDQDVDAPGPDAQTLASQQEASVAPSFYGNKDHFSGDGFSEGSNLESDKNNRRKPGGGMSLSIPVQ